MIEYSIAKQIANEKGELIDMIEKKTTTKKDKIKSNKIKDDSATKRNYNRG